MPTAAFLLLLSLVTPLLGAVLIVWQSDQRQAAVRQSALVTSLVTLILAAWGVGQFPGGEEEVFAATDVSWLAVSGLEIRFSIGLDGLSLWLYALTPLLVTVSILLGWHAAAERVAAYYTLLLLFEAGALGVFVARDVVLFSLAFEFTILPLFFLIGIWGREERRAAATKFFLFSFAGSLLTLLGILMLVVAVAQHSASGSMTFSFSELAAAAESHPLPERWQVWILLTLLVGFALRMPLVPFHRWLLSALIQAPLPVSLLIAGVLLKLGCYGLLRVGIELLPQGAVWWMPVVLWWAMLSVLYAALAALMQTDWKRLIAYASVSQLSFCVLGLFALNEVGIVGGALHMVNHGLAIAGLMACLGLLHERYRTSSMRHLGRVAQTMPILTGFTMLFALASLGLPGLNGFISLYWLLSGLIEHRGLAVLALFGVLLTAWYLLRFVKHVFFGQLKESLPLLPVRDLNAREVAALAPLVVMIVWIGVRPSFFTAPMSLTANRVAARLERAIDQQTTPHAQGAAHE